VATSVDKAKLWLSPEGGVVEGGSETDHEELLKEASFQPKHGKGLPKNRTLRNIVGAALVAGWIRAGVAYDAGEGGDILFVDGTDAAVRKHWGVIRDVAIAHRVRKIRGVVLDRSGDDIGNLLAVDLKDVRDRPPIVYGSVLYPTRIREFLRRPRNVPVRAHVRRRA